MVCSSRWLGGKGVEACSHVRPMQRLMPAIELSDGHHSSFTLTFLKIERI
jgi:hypothetical protein